MRILRFCYICNQSQLNYKETHGFWCSIIQNVSQCGYSGDDARPMKDIGNDRADGVSAGDEAISHYSQGSAHDVHCKTGA